MISWLLPLNTAIRKKRAAGLIVLAVLLSLFLAFNRFPKLDIVEEDLEAVASPQAQCFQGFCIESEDPLLKRWWDFSLTYLQLVTAGMTFAFLVAGATEAFMFPGSRAGMAFAGGGLKGAFRGLFVGPAMTLCSACIVPISNAFRRRGASVEAAVSIVQGSSTLNLPALIMAAMVFTPMLSGSRIGMSVVGALLIGPLVGMAAGRHARPPEEPETDWPLEEYDSTWGEALTDASVQWIRASVSYFIRLAPIMVLAGFASGLAIQWISPDTVSRYLGDNATGIAVAATIGILINVPLMFEIPLVAALLLVGMGTAPAAVLLFAAAAGGPITFWGLARALPIRATATFVGATWMLGVLGGVAILFIDQWTDSEAGLRSPALAARMKESEPVTPFTDVAAVALNGGYVIWNDRPGVAMFDYDRDGDLDFYVTSQGEQPNRLYRNDGRGIFDEVAESAGVTAVDSHSTGAVACDLDNDGFQDLYVGAWGDPTDLLDFRSPSDGQGNRDVLFHNNGDGTFTDVTDSAFGESVNVRSATTIACGDVDRDGWLDLYVGNLAAHDFRTLASAHHPGHYNVLFRNNGDMTFSEIADLAGVRGPQIVMRDMQGEPIIFEDPETGERYEGYDPTERDKLGNLVGEPTGQTHGVLFFDYDDDRDVDLWVANDGDRLLLFRNDSTNGTIKFTRVEEEMGLATVGSWMAFSVGDYDGDADLDVFVTNVGPHVLRYPLKDDPAPVCEYHAQFEWGTCFHLLLRNDGTRDEFGNGTSARFVDVAPLTSVVPSRWMPPETLDPDNVDDDHDYPTGLSAYDFGFGATFFDFDNDTDQDLYWLGSIARGEGPGGQIFPSAGRMLRSYDGGSFEDITVRAHLLDISRVNYDNLDGLATFADDPMAARLRRIDVKSHEDGKGLAHGDLNGDGYVDLIGTNSSGEIFVGPYDGTTGTAPSEDKPGPMFVWMNGGGDNHWITIRLQGRMAIDGTGTNADGIGARVYVVTGDANGERTVQVQEVRAGSSYLSMDSVELEFGLGAATVVDDIVVLWPSGRSQYLENIPADQALLITEPES